MGCSSVRTRAFRHAIKGLTPQGITPILDQKLSVNRVFGHWGGNIAMFSHVQFGRVLAVRWIGLPVRQAQHFLLSAASLSILGYQHNLADEPAIVLWNAPRTTFRLSDMGTATGRSAEMHSKAFDFCAIAVDREVCLASHALLRSGQLGPIETQFFTRTANDASIKNLVRATHRHLGLSTLTMNCYVGMAYAALLPFSVEAATTFGQPFLKRRAFHRFSPVPVSSRENHGPRRPPSPSSAPHSRRRRRAPLLHSSCA
jgi:histidine phosphatase superfamily protein (branch 1)